MTRIASSMISQTALLDLQKAQQGLFKASSQTASQTKASDVEGYGSQAQTLVSANRLVARIESRLQVGAELVREGVPLPVLLDQFSFFLFPFFLIVILSVWYPPYLCGCFVIIHLNVF